MARKFKTVDEALDTIMNGLPAHRIQALNYLRSEFASNDNTDEVAELREANEGLRSRIEELEAEVTKLKTPKKRTRKKAEPKADEETES